jgi:hypothetical protein
MTLEQVAGKPTDHTDLEAEENRRRFASYNDDAPATEISKPDRPSKVASKNLKILVADDDQPLRKVLGKILKTARPPLRRR